MAEDKNLTGSMKVSIDGTYTKTLDLTTPRDQLGANGAFTQSIANGAGAGQANVLWHDRRTLSAGEDDDLDLAGVLKDAFGDTVNLARIKGLLVIADANNTSKIFVGGGATHPVPLFDDPSDRIALDPGCSFALFVPTADGIPVSVGSADNIRVSHGDETSEDVSYRIVVMGADE